MSLRLAPIGPGRGLRPAQLASRVLWDQSPPSRGFDPQNRAAFRLVPDPASDPPRTRLKADSRALPAGAPGTRPRTLLLVQTFRWTQPKLITRAFLGGGGGWGTGRLKRDSPPRSRPPRTNRADAAKDRLHHFVFLLCSPGTERRAHGPRGFRARGPQKHLR